MCLFKQGGNKMNCPVCGSSSMFWITLKTDQFQETLHTCKSCSTVLSENHGKIEVVQDGASKSFLGATTENVESDDYNF